MRSQVKFLYSDSPKEHMLRDLRNALAAAEDFLHLVIRCEYCVGRRVDCTQEILELQLKFLNAMVLDDEIDPVDRIYHGEAGVEIDWESVDATLPVDRQVWEQYVKEPFQCHREYVAQLKRITEKYPHHMTQADKKGRPMLEIIKAGSSHQHFHYLQNGSIFYAIAHGVVIKGASPNEAEHWEHEALGRECLATTHGPRPLQRAMLRTL